MPNRCKSCSCARAAVCPPPPLAGRHRITPSFVGHERERDAHEAKWTKREQALEKEKDALTEAQKQYKLSLAERSKAIDREREAANARIAEAEIAEHQAREATASAEAAWRQLDEQRRTATEESDAAKLVLERASKAKKSILAARARIDGELGRLRKDRTELEKNRKLLRKEEESIMFNIVAMQCTDNWCHPFCLNARMLPDP